MDLTYEVNGKGNPIVLIHSGGADMRDWTYLAPLLAKENKVVTFDGRGVGKSPMPNKHVNYVEDLLSLMDYLEIKQATIIGHSIGGQVATDFALNYPERVTKLVVIAPSLSGFNYSNEFNHHMNSIIEAAPNIDKMLEIALHTPTYQVVINSLHKDLTVQMLRLHFQHILQWPPDLCISWPQPPANERLGELKPKTLFIIGKQEIQDNFLVAERFQEVPEICFVEIDDADHLVTLTHPEELYEKITSFMEDRNLYAKNT